VPLQYDYSQAILLAILGTARMMDETEDPAQKAPALVLAGAPAPVARQAVFYNFTPTVVQNIAWDSKLVFSIQNKPDWASFGKRHGTLYGTPTAQDAGKYADIRITVTDGTTTGHLPPFTLEVPAAPRAAAR
jgi:hypothetical protein